MEKYSIYIMDAKRGERNYMSETFGFETFEHMFIYIYMGNNTGIMLTSKDFNRINFSVEPGWFDHYFRIKHTHYVPECLIKEVPEIKFKKISGGLSDEGKRVFDDFIKDKTPIHWNDYITKPPHRAV